MKNILFPLLIAILSSCGNANDKQNNTNTETKEIPSNSNDANSNNSGNTNDNRISNAGEAKRPRGKMSYEINGSPVTVDENMVQCMYVGMNNTMAQSVISGGNQCTITHMGIPKIGDVEIYAVAGTMPNVAIQIIIDGVQYNNKKVGDAKLTITKVTQDGKNYYVGGTFSGKLTSIDGGKTVTVTNGVFESAYL